MVFAIEKELESLEELINFQKNKLLKLARRRITYLTPEDIMQPNDYPELEQDPEFRYEEGVLQGLLSAQMLFQRTLKDQIS